MAFRQRTLCASFMVFGWSLAAAPAVQSSDDQPVLAPFQACKKVQDSERRLSCFEDALNKAEAKLTIASPAPKPERDVPPAQSPSASTLAATPNADADNFGLSQQQIAARDGTKDESSQAREEDKPRLTATITRVDKSATGRAVIYLDNGQVWTETEKRPSLPIKIGSKIEIVRGGFGGYRLRVEGRSGFLYVQRAS